MKFMSQKCIDQLTQQGVHSLLPLVVQWIAGREFKKATGTQADVVAYDAAAQTAFADAVNEPTSITSFSGGAATDTFSNAVVEFFNTTARCPGWNAAACSFDWGEFACFCAAAVPFDPALIVDLGKTQPANEPIAYECNPAVKADPVYKTASTGGSGIPLVISTDKDAGYGWKTWAVGGAVAVGLGVAGYMVFGKKGHGSSARSNPESELYDDLTEAVKRARLLTTRTKREHYVGMGPSMPGKPTPFQVSDSASYVNTSGVYIETAPNLWNYYFRMDNRGRWYNADKSKAFQEIVAAAQRRDPADWLRAPAKNPGGHSGHKHYTLAELEAMPTLEHGHFDNLKIKTPTTLVWLSRMTKADGAPYDNGVTVENYRNGKLESVDVYQAR